MDWTEWKPFYQEIVSELGLDVERDRKATEILTNLLEDIDPIPLLERLDSLIRHKTVVVCGAGPSLEKHLDLLLRESAMNDAVFIVADGAASALLELGHSCDVLITDLDGAPESIRRCTSEGAVTIVHGHGDNIHRVEELVPTLGPVLGSTQVEPTHRAFLWGGFTDGDRACYIASHYEPKEIIMAGMDLGETVGKWSKPGHEDHYPASTRKRVKLQIAERLLAHLIDTTTVDYRVME